MGFIELFLIAVGLSMDAFAVSICKGLGMRQVRWAHAVVIALFFGAFQGIMPIIGWALGTQFAALIEPVDHWVAFILLAFIGGKMVWDGVHEEEQCADCGGSGATAPEKLDLKELFLLAIATSIDALAVGISLAFLGANIWVSAAVIGVVTFLLSFIGVAVGNRIGARFNRTATIVGGIVLILIGLRILLEHLDLLIV